jgi:20S proteasome alpha/beta subunit
MTLIIGILCQDGVVVGSDGMATFGSLGQRTIQQPVKKLSQIGDCIAIGTSGPVGLGQRFAAALQDLWANKKLSGKASHEATTILQDAFWQYARREFEAAKVTAPMLGQSALESAISYTVLAMPLDKKPCLIQFNQQCSPELATKDLPFIAVGSGQLLADSFLAFLRRIFWQNGLPKVSEGVLATVWSLEQAIRTNPGGVGPPIQVVTLEKVGADWKVKELTESDFAEHRQAIADAEGILAKYRDFLKPAQGESVPPSPSTKD